MRKKLGLLCTAVLFCLVCNGQEDWKLKSNKDGIEVYVKDAENSDLKAIRVKCSLQATVSQITAIVLDVNTGAEWVYSTKSSTLLKQVSPLEVYYYSEVALPWPLTNRDFVAHLKASQNPATKVVTIDGPVIHNYVPEKKGIVRVNNSSGKWIISPAPKNMVKIDYTLVTNPGGSIPTWLVNLFAAKGPTETFRMLKEQAAKPAYKRVKLPSIVD
jgi:hypothetical protein